MIFFRKTYSDFKKKQKKVINSNLCSTDKKNRKHKKNLDFLNMMPVNFPQILPLLTLILVIKKRPILLRYYLCINIC